MITRIEALNYRSLRYVNQTLDPFQVLIGPNASGKSTFLDVPYFISEILNAPSITDATRARATDLRDLSWMRREDWFELAVEARIPDTIEVSDPRHTNLRYEIRLGVNEPQHQVTVLDEALWFLGDASDNRASHQPKLFPKLDKLPERITLGSRRTPKGWRKIVSKTNTGNDYFKSEKNDWNNNFRLGPQRPALANLPQDVERFPAAMWFQQHIAEGVQRIMLNSAALRRPAPPQSPRRFLPDGSNLPWVVHQLERDAPDQLQEWIAFVRTALPDVRAIRTVERPEDRHRYLLIEYDSGLEAPSWLISDGTLRMLALTILAYLPDLDGIYLIEEPENGIHPRAVETVFQSLRTIYDAQVFLATHSSLVLGMTESAQLLCFALTDKGETDIVRGDVHPNLQSWRGEVNLSTLYAAGVLS